MLQCIENDLINHCTGLFVKHCKRAGFVFDQPSSSASEVLEEDGCIYVFLRNGHGTLAVYCKESEDARMRYVEVADWPLELML